MSFYSCHIFPRFLDWVMSGPELAEERAKALQGVSGEVLEIGFGTGRNLPFYPSEVRHLTAIDSNPGMASLAQARLDQSPFPVELQTLNGEELPLDAGRFDCVVSTWTLCSIPHVERALCEVWRVLKPGGRLYFVEHGLSPEPAVAAWQHRLNPVQKFLANGCHLNRDMRTLVSGPGLEIVKIENLYMPRSPRFMGYLYRGVARK